MRVVKLSWLRLLSFLVQRCGHSSQVGEEGGEGGELPGDLDQPGVIQVSPQDKEAIERVSECDDSC